MPQVPPDSSWQRTSATMALTALDRTTREFRIDPARTCLAGLSMGGNGAWYLLYNHPDRFTAALEICGFISGRGTYCAADVEYTELAGIGHNAWDPAFASPALVEWLLAQRR